MRNRIEIAGQISVYYVGVAPAQMPMDILDCVHRPASGTVAVRIVLEVGLEDRFQYELGGGLNHPIANGGNAERTLAFAIRFRDHYPPHRIGPIRLRDQFLAQACQPPFRTLLLDLVKGHPIHTRSPRIGAGKPIGMTQDVLATDLVVKHVEAENRLRRRLAMQLSLERPDLIWCYRAHRQSPSLAIFESAPEVRALCSAGITRPQRSNDPVRLPPWPPPDATFEAATLARNGSPPL